MCRQLWIGGGWRLDTVEASLPTLHTPAEKSSPFFEEEIFSGSEEIFSPLQHFAKFPGLSIMSQKAIGKTRILISLLSNYSISGINWYQHSAVIWEMFEKKYFPSAISSFLHLHFVVILRRCWWQAFSIWQLRVPQSCCKLEISDWRFASFYLAT